MAIDKLVTLGGIRELSTNIKNDINNKIDVTEEHIAQVETSVNEINSELNTTNEKIQVVGAELARLEENLNGYVFDTIGQSLNNHSPLPYTYMNNATGTTYNLVTNGKFQIDAILGNTVRDDDLEVLKSTKYSKIDIVSPNLFNRNDLINDGDSSRLITANFIPLQTVYAIGYDMNAAEAGKVEFEILLFDANKNALGSIEQYGELDDNGHVKGTVAINNYSSAKFIKIVIHSADSFEWVTDVMFNIIVPSSASAFPNSSLSYIPYGAVATKLTLDTPVELKSVTSSIYDALRVKEQENGTYDLVKDNRIRTLHLKDHDFTFEYVPNEYDDWVQITFDISNTPAIANQSLCSLNMRLINAMASSTEHYFNTATEIVIFLLLNRIVDHSNNLTKEAIQTYLTNKDVVIQYGLKTAKEEKIKTGLTLDQVTSDYLRYHNVEINDANGTDPRAILTFVYKKIKS